jgi:endonuclease YncB( thermonuclease family)
VLHVLLASSAFAEDFTGPVVGVIDGDSIRVMQEGRVEEI